MENRLVPSSLLLHVIVCSLLGIVHRLYLDLLFPLKLWRKRKRQNNNKMCVFYLQAIYIDRAVSGVFLRQISFYTTIHIIILPYLCT